MTILSRVFTPMLLLVGAVRLQAAPAASDTNFFPIMAWNWAPKDPVVLNKMREAGLTIAGFVAPRRWMPVTPPG